MPRALPVHGRPEPPPQRVVCAVRAARRRFQFLQEAPLLFWVSSCDDGDVGVHLYETCPCKVVLLPVLCCRCCLVCQYVCSPVDKIFVDVKTFMCRRVRQPSVPLENPTNG